jgi:hypothetical protein
VGFANKRVLAIVSRDAREGRHGVALRPSAASLYGLTRCLATSLRIWQLQGELDGYVLGICRGQGELSRRMLIGWDASAHALVGRRARVIWPCVLDRFDNRSPYGCQVMSCGHTWMDGPPNCSSCRSRCFGNRVDLDRLHTRIADKTKRKKAGGMGVVGQSSGQGR